MSYSLGSIVTVSFNPRLTVASASSIFHVPSTPFVSLAKPPKIPLCLTLRYSNSTPNFRIAGNPGVGNGAKPSSYRISSFRCFSALTAELRTTLDKVVSSHKVVLFMKGTKEFPQCGFSNTVVQILRSLNVAFESINILENENLRQGLKEYSSWPTFPQLYIEGEFFGGCDITVEAYQSGELQELLEKATCS